MNKFIDFLVRLMVAIIAIVISVFILIPFYMVKGAFEVSLIAIEGIVSFVKTGSWDVLDELTTEYVEKE